MRDHDPRLDGADGGDWIVIVHRPPDSKGRELAVRATSPPNRRLFLSTEILAIEVLVTMGKDMNPTSSSRSEASSAGSYHDGLEILEAQLWDRARRNLRLLYNGGRIAPAASQNPNAYVGQLAVVTPKI
ncbi:hypothetical protein [Paludisphaera mucosa]|uniref:Uncharacterized protein n=1 Tax=Paludisphaera mucosa TaxID=3030827 RepID=A0ABT6FDF6_9BACT|nr:hypothetical protein [Paludisphaera mucosa]MDG3005595.1 hypothetical protein [Paludisphaera mucosa]